MLAMTNVDAVVLDLEGVYFEHGDQRFIDFLTGYGHSREKVIQVYKRHNKVHLHKRGEESSESFWDHIIRNLELRGETKESLLEKMAEQYEENLSLIEWTQSLRKQGKIIAACSNTYIDRVEKLQEKFDFLRNFDHTVFSYEPDVRTLKPNPYIFHILAYRLNLPPERIFMTDDRLDNVHALDSLGFKSALYKSVPELIQEYEELTR
jgi:HAD superfamily hydrolase (TIGR01509 family)